MQSTVKSREIENSRNRQKGRNEDPIYKEAGGGREIFLDANLGFLIPLSGCMSDTHQRWRNVT